MRSAGADVRCTIKDATATLLPFATIERKTIDLWPSMTWIAYTLLRARQTLHSR